MLDPAQPAGSFGERTPQWATHSGLRQYIAVQLPVQWFHQLAVV